MRVTTEVKKMCEAEAARCIKIAKEKYPGSASKFLPVRITYDVRGQCAGKANWSRWTIKLNPILLMENIKEMVENTASHEVAHLIDREVHGVLYSRRINRRTGRRNRIVHGPTFKRIQNQFGRCDATFHDMDTSNARVRTKRSTKVHVWKCGRGCAEMVLTPKLHARMLATGTRYVRNHSVRRCGKYSYFGIKGQELKPMPVAARSPAPKPRAPRGTETKLDKCRKVYDPDLNRAANIVAFTEEGCTPAGAATYFAKIKKEF